jgi:hypothetical protein
MAEIHAFDFSLADKLACIEREYRLRKECYPRWVQMHRMTQHKADKELALMASIAEDYRKLAGQDLLL